MEWATRDMKEVFYAYIGVVVAAIAVLLVATVAIRLITVPTDQPGFAASISEKMKLVEQYTARVGSWKAESGQEVNGGEHGHNIQLEGGGPSESAASDCTLSEVLREGDGEEGAPGERDGSLDTNDVLGKQKGGEVGSAHVYGEVADDPSLAGKGGEVIPSEAGKMGIDYIVLRYEDLQKLVKRRHIRASQVDSVWRDLGAIVPEDPLISEKPDQGTQRTHEGLVKETGAALPSTGVGLISFGKVLYFFGALLCIAAFTFLMMVSWFTLGSLTISIGVACFTLGFRFAGGYLFSIDKFVPSGLMYMIAASTVPAIVFGLQYAVGGFHSTVAFFAVGPQSSMWAGMEASLLISSLVTLKSVHYSFISALAWMAAIFFARDVPCFLPLSRRFRRVLYLVLSIMLLGAAFYMRFTAGSVALRLSSEGNEEMWRYGSPAEFVSNCAWWGCIVSTIGLSLALLHLERSVVERSLKDALRILNTFCIECVVVAMIPLNFAILSYIFILALLSTAGALAVYGCKPVAKLFGPKLGKLIVVLVTVSYGVAVCVGPAEPAIALIMNDTAFQAAAPEVTQGITQCVGIAFTIAGILLESARAARFRYDMWFLTTIDVLVFAPSLLITRYLGWMVTAGLLPHSFTFAVLHLLGAVVLPGPRSSRLHAVLFCSMFVLITVALRVAEANMDSDVVSKVQVLFAVALGIDRDAIDWAVLIRCAYIWSAIGAYGSGLMAVFARLEKSKHAVLVTDVDRHTSAAHFQSGCLTMTVAATLGYLINEPALFVVALLSKMIVAVPGATLLMIPAQRSHKTRGTILSVVCLVHAVAVVVWLLGTRNPMGFATGAARLVCVPAALLSISLCILSLFLHRKWVGTLAVLAYSVTQLMAMMWMYLIGQAMVASVVLVLLVVGAAMLSRPWDPDNGATLFSVILFVLFHVSSVFFTVLGSLLSSSISALHTMVFQLFSLSAAVYAMLLAWNNISESRRTLGAVVPWSTQVCIAMAVLLLSMEEGVRFYGLVHTLTGVAGFYIAYAAMFNVSDGLVSGVLRLATIVCMLFFSTVTGSLIVYAAVIALVLFRVCIFFTRSLIENLFMGAALIMIGPVMQSYQALLSGCLLFVLSIARVVFVVFPAAISVPVSLVAGGILLVSLGVVYEDIADLDDPLHLGMFRLETAPLYVRETSRAVLQLLEHSIADLAARFNVQLFAA